ncbi:MAG: ribosome maturation factor RimM [Gammaproteobacteria bacterium]|nr:ribosome maturation factor RimM [Gammaproteobacteria bacterium]MDH5651384.1 ribosome maturation factor RimM [Gammaproteobacteria bacterium]
MTGLETNQQWVVLGRVAGVYGVKGWVKVISHTVPPDNILDYSPWYLQQDGRLQAFEVIEGKTHGKGIIAYLANCTDRDVAARLVGTDILVERDRLPVLEDNEYYWADLIGLQVQNSDGQQLGIVESLLETGANDVLVVRGSDKQEHLIPYIQGEVIREINLALGIIRVDWDLEY